MIFVTEIKRVTFNNVECLVDTGGDSPIRFTRQWYDRYRPTEGDIITMNEDGYYAVCPRLAFSAIKQVYSL